MSKGARHLDDSSDEKRLQELMRNAQGGDAISYRSLLLEIEKMISSFVKNSFFRLGLVGSSAWEDVTQEILLSIHAKRATYNPNQYFLPWLYSIARYKVIDFARAARTVSKFIDLELDLLELDVAHPQVEESNTSRDLLALFDDLPQKQRQVLELVKIQGLTIAEAATETSFSHSDIKVTIHRAIKTLQKRLRGEMSQ
ncbi:MAG: sigma-70 family RNA polymerase sigma factor [Bdellovibrionales bacterium]|nr:sigma-70 family RNA polymerase sigma factor [Bdellovibrionales bacterium]